MDKGRGSDMANIINSKSDYIVKLAATSVGLSVAIVKLLKYKNEIISDINKDIQYIKQLENDYMESSEFDKMLAEELTGVSAEVDKLLEMRENDDE